MGANCRGGGSKLYGCGAGVRRAAARPAALPLGRRAVLALVGGAAAAAATSVAGTPQASAGPLEFEVDPGTGLQRVKYDPAGWSFWKWRGHRVHYIAAGADNTGPPVLLIHGYGASAYHWRWQLPVLAAAGYRAYAVCLLGFGWSDKAVTDYGAGNLWADQLADFCKEVINGAGAGGGSAEGAEGAAAAAAAASGTAAAAAAPEPAILCGNSLGGYAALVTAARNPDLVRGLCLVNSAGPLKSDAEDDPSADDVDGTAPPTPRAWWAPAADAATAAVKRVVLFFAFQRARQPERIKEVLSMVYTNSQSSIDDDLVESIRVPATDPNAAEVFYRINASSPSQPPSVNALMRRLRALQLPTLLLWGQNDPWIVMSRAQRLKAIYPEASLVSIDAGHCGHDEAPAQANEALLNWLAGLRAAKA
ncbi:metal-nicotianamine transporter [Raphidocelis subcapitata]|uniref:Metal-nicotianamine transporter n=1 Tax=Raphidocelis subcapitata TaxID=307507 RepID=A0A2V0NRZ5_9CHLO|nr:metal-nicotianamine transporter [Raphidocelis subcapitata]|eukprot:GBF90099.1 metal-nicotianamine transporter [Raphidocelis subcapitata]